MFKKGDIIFIEDYIADDGVTVGSHPFLVISDKKGIVEGLCFDTVGTVMSSFDGKPIEYKKRKLSHEENMPIEASETTITNGKAKDGYTKADQLYFFEKDEIKYKYFGQADPQVLTNLLSKINYLDSKGKVKNIIYNLKNKIEPIDVTEEKIEETANKK